MSPVGVVPREIMDELLPLALAYAAKYAEDYRGTYPDRYAFHPTHNDILWRAIPDPDARRRLGLRQPRGGAA